MSFKPLTLSFSIYRVSIEKFKNIAQRYSNFTVLLFLSILSIYNYILYYFNKLGLSYNDARSHLDIGRRVVEGLKPGLAQLGSVWLPLPHLLMVPTIWNDFMWHSGLSGAIISMISYVSTGFLIFLFLRMLRVNFFGSLVGVVVFALNMNILYLQSTAMTELLLLATMTAGVYYLVKWHTSDKILDLIWASVWVMLATLVRYDGYLLLFVSSALVAFHVFRKKGFKATEGTVVFFLTIAGLGIALWLLWNLLIFKDPLYFAFGPYSAHAQQQQLRDAGVLVTKGNIKLSFITYFYAITYNSGFVVLILGFLGAILFWFDKKITANIRVASVALFVPFIFNVLALYLGHSVLFIQGLSGDTWFNVRYGVVMMPTFAIFIGYLVYKLKNLRLILTAIIIVVLLLAIANKDAVTIDDARVGSSQKNVSEVSSWLNENAKDKDGFVLISAASHDAIIFSSGLPMKKFIHEGTGAYWISATGSPDRWARWIVLRTNDVNDQTFRLIKDKPGFKKYNKVKSFPFADIYEIKPEYVNQLNTKEVFLNQK